MTSINSISLQALQSASNKLQQSADQTISRSNQATPPPHIPHESVDIQVNSNVEETRLNENITYRHDEIVHNSLRSDDFSSDNSNLRSDANNLINNFPEAIDHSNEAADVINRIVAEQAFRQSINLFNAANNLAKTTIDLSE